MKKKWPGIVWIAMAFPAAWYGIFKMEIPKIISGNQEDIHLGIIIILIIIPVAATGLFFFGKYALQGEYDDRIVTDKFPIDDSSLKILDQ